jgi:hypothetical protein
MPTLPPAAAAAAATVQGPSAAALLIGTQTDILKPFVRLTGPPVAERVRPEPVLRRALALVQAKYAAQSTGEEALINPSCLANDGHLWFWHQMKSIRQDLTVQGIENDLTVQAYETHARISLELGEHHIEHVSELVACLTQLLHLFLECGLTGSHPLALEEFTSYQLLHCCVTNNSAAFVRCLYSTSQVVRSSEAVSHASKVYFAVADGNWCRFFNLLDAAPNMSCFLMDHLVDRVRCRALDTLQQSVTDLPLAYVMDVLRLPATGSVCKDWCLEQGLSVELDHEGNDVLRSSRTA